MSGQRNIINTPHPIYGIDAGGFSVGDLPPSYTSSTPILTDATGNTTSAAVQINANMGAQFTLAFTDAATSCDVTILRADIAGDTPLVTFKGCNNLTPDLYVGYFDQRVVFSGVAVKVQTSNWVGTGKLSVSGCRTN